MDSKSILKIFTPILIIFSLILSIVLINLSNNFYSDGRNYWPGIFSGMILMVFSVFCLGIFFMGNQGIFYGSYYFWVIGGLFLTGFLILIVGFMNRTKEDFAPTGVCMKNGEMGINYDGKCLTKEDQEVTKKNKEANDTKNHNKCENLKKQLKKDFSKCNLSSEFSNIKKNILSKSQDFSKDFSNLKSNIQNESQDLSNNLGNLKNKLTNESGKIKGVIGGNLSTIGKKMDNFVGGCDGINKFLKSECRTPSMDNIVRRSQEIGICEYEENGKLKFGYSHPYFGKKCVDSGRIEEMLKEHPEYGKLHKVNFKGFEINPFQSTQCFGFPKENLMDYDLKCKEKFGNQYGLKKIDSTGCPENDFRGLCEINYQMGEQLEEGSTKCVPVGMDMNTVCQRKNLLEKKTKFLNMGYKTIKFGGCPQGTQRAICDGNYYNGKELFENSTECFPDYIDPDRKCKEKFGNESSSINIISDNCVPGFIRSICRN